MQYNHVLTWLHSVSNHDNVTSAGIVEIVLHVVTVHFGTTEDDRLVHLVDPDRTDSVISLQDLDGLRQHLWNNQDETQSVNMPLGM